MERRLYEASLSGCVDTLNALIQKDKLILDRDAVTWFDETPLHIAALRGHLHFTKALLNQKPKLATGLDSRRRSPLHLASAEGYDDIVQELLSVNLDMCNVRDGDGRIPLHLAVIKGRLEVIKKLITAQPKSTRETLDHGETILHLSVNCCCFEVLKLLVESVSDVDEFLNSQDSNGNTILHLASILKQQEIVKYLLSKSGVEANKNALNKNGLTALDVLEHCPKDVKGMELLYFLHEARVRRANELITPTPPSPPPPPQEEEVVDHQHNEIVGAKKMSIKIRKWMKCLSTGHVEKWYEHTQQTLMLVATVLASMSFQAAMNPPGGVWQEDSTVANNSASACAHFNCSVGTSVLNYTHPKTFTGFLILNTGSLIASLSIILLIISGFPLKNKLCTWLLILIMCMAVVFMALAYLLGMIMVADGPMPPENTYGISLYIWFGIIGMVGTILLARFLYWLVKRLREFTPKMQSCMKNEWLVRRVARVYA